MSPRHLKGGGDTKARARSTQRGASEDIILAVVDNCPNELTMHISENKNQFFKSNPGMKKSHLRSRSIATHGTTRANSTTMRATVQNQHSRNTGTLMSGVIMPSVSRNTFNKKSSSVLQQQ